MERSGLNGAQPWDLELLCGREKRRREEGGMERGKKKKKEKWGRGKRVEERGRAGVSEKQGVRDRWTKEEGREGGGSGTTDVLSLGQPSALFSCHCRGLRWWTTRSNKRSLVRGMHREPWPESLLSRLAGFKKRTSDLFHARQIGSNRSFCSETKPNCPSGSAPSRRESLDLSTRGEAKQG